MKTCIITLIAICERLRLDGREILQKYDLEELNSIYNGIGPDRFPEHLRDFITSVNRLLEPPALIHDVDFHEGGTKEDFTAANKRFRKNCYTVVKDKFGWYNPLRYHWLFKAWRFAGYCEEFGWKGYTKKEDEKK